jgi:predicted DNA-binding transcriptional regulator YafY
MWSADFVTSRPRFEVTVRASPHAVRIFPELFGDAVRPAIERAGPPDQDGWRRLTLTFEHVDAAVYRLSGLGDLVEVLEPAEVRDGIVGNARRTLESHGEFL